MILYPAIDIRGGHAVRLLQGDYDHETVYDADPVDAARRWVDAGRALPSRRRPRRRPRRAPGQPRPRATHRRAASTSRSRSAAACATPRPSAPRSTPGAERGGARHRRAASARRSSRSSSPSTASASSSRSTRAAAAWRSPGWEQHTEVEPAELIASLAGRGVARFVYTPVDVDGTMQGPGLADLRGVADASRCRADLLGRGRRARRPRGAARARPRQPRRSDRRPGAVRGPLHRRRGPGGPGRGSTG